MVLLKRFELPTLALRKPCSTPELQQRAASTKTGKTVCPAFDLYIE